MPRRACALLCLLACGPSDADTVAETAASTTSTTAPTTGDCDTTCPEEQFGVACLELFKGEGQDADPTVGTAKINITLNYEPCLIDYYTGKHAADAMGEPAGDALLAAWQARLCSEPIADLVPCTVEGFEQVLDPGDVVPRYAMTITYATPQPAEILGNTLLWGPAPLESHAECDPGDRPYVRLTGLQDVVGLDASDTMLWRMQSFGQTPRALIQSTATDCLQLPIAAN